jgi:type I restriction enzyme S subunit
VHTIYQEPLPTGWKEAPLGSLVVTKRGCSWSKEQERERPSETTIPVTRIPNIQASLNLGDLLHLEGVSAAQRAASAVTKGWTLMVGSNGNPKRIGDSVLVTADRQMVFASFLFALRPWVNSACPITDEFLACWLQAHQVHEFISETSQMTTGLANMSWSATRRLPVRYPEQTAEQDRVAEALRAADDHIDGLEAELTNAATLTKGLLQSAFVRGLAKYKHNITERREVVCPSAWRLLQLADLLAEAEYGLSAAFSDKGRYQILRMENVTDGNVHQADPVYIDLSPEAFERYRVRRGDILFNRTNSWDLVGRVGIVREDLPAVFASYLVRLRVRQDLVDPFFLNFALNSPSVKRRYRRYVTPAVAQANINVRNLKQTWIALPDMAQSREQAEIVEVIATADAQASTLQAELAAARRVKQSLVQNLLTGRIRLKP